MPYNLPIDNAQRISVLETQIKVLKEEIQDLKIDIKSVDDKLDELLALRNKGAGAFWLATSLAGAGAISIFVQIIHWIGLK